MRTERIYFNEKEPRENVRFFKIFGVTMFKLCISTSYMRKEVFKDFLGYAMKYNEKKRGPAIVLAFKKKGEVYTTEIDFRGSTNIMTVPAGQCFTGTVKCPFTGTEYSIG